MRKLDLDQIMEKSISYRNKVLLEKRYKAGLKLGTWKGHQYRRQVQQMC